MADCAERHGLTLMFDLNNRARLDDSWAELVREEDIFVALQAEKTGVRIRSVNNINSCELYSQEHGVSRDQHLRFQHDLDMGRTFTPENFIRTLNREAEPLTRASEAVTLMELIDAVYLSANSGRPVGIRNHQYRTL